MVDYLMTSDTLLPMPQPEKHDKRPALGSALTISERIASDPPSHTSGTIDEKDWERHYQKQMHAVAPEHKVLLNVMSTDTVVPDTIKTVPATPNGQDHSHSAVAATTPPASAETQSQGIPEKHQKTWRSLLKLGAKPTDMAKFEGYLASDAPMTDAIMVAGVRALGKLPHYKKERPEYNALANHIMDKLHARFAKSGDEAEKEKIFWVVRSGYLAMYSKGLNMEIEEMLGSRSQDNLPDFNDRTDKAIKRCLEKHDPTKGRLLALVSTAVNNEIVNVYRKVYGGSGSVARRNFAAPVSLDTGGLDGGSMEEALPIYNISVLDGLVEREERAAREGRLESIRTLRPEDAGIAPQQAKFLAHYQRQSDDVPFPSIKALAAELGVSEGTVKTHNSRTLRKLIKHFENDKDSQVAIIVGRENRAQDELLPKTIAATKKTNIHTTSKVNDEQVELLLAAITATEKTHEHTSNGHGSNGHDTRAQRPATKQLNRVNYDTVADQYPTLDSLTSLLPRDRELITACHTLRESGAALNEYNISRKMGVSVRSARSYAHLLVKKLGLSESDAAKEPSFQAREAARTGAESSNIQRS